MELKYVKSSFDFGKFYNELSNDLKLKISGCKHENGVLVVYISEVLDSNQNASLLNIITNHDPSRELSQAEQREKDKNRFEKRAEVKNKLISEMAAGNLERVRLGLWSTSDLVALTQDSQLKGILDDVATLSFEIAYSKMDSISNPLVTQDIKDEWKQLLYEHFYL